MPRRRKAAAGLRWQWRLGVEDGAPVEAAGGGLNDLRHSELMGLGSKEIEGGEEEIEGSGCGQDLFFFFFLFLFFF